MHDKQAKTMDIHLDEWTYNYLSFVSPFLVEDIEML